MNLIKLNLGCGDIVFPDYINIDLYSEKADIKADIRKLSFSDDYADEIIAYHVIEHFDFHEAFEVLKEWKRVLKPGGRLMLETPDFLKSCKAFISADEQNKIGLYSHFFSEPWKNSGFVHKFLYTENQLRWTLEQIGFKNIAIGVPIRYTGRGDVHLRMECIK